jgi:hypothetical protein
MRAKITHASEVAPKSNSRASRAYLFALKGEDGRSYKVWTDDSLGNCKRWREALLGFLRCKQDGREIWLTGLNLWKGIAGRVDADSYFKIEIIVPATREVPADEAVAPEPNELTVEPDPEQFRPAEDAPEERFRRDVHG